MAPERQVLPAPALVLACWCGDARTAGGHRRRDSRGRSLRGGRSRDGGGNGCRSGGPGGRSRRRRDEPAFKLELAQRHLGLEAEPERAPVADRTGEEAAGDGAEEDGEVLGAARNQAVGEEPGSGAESGPADDSDDGKADDDGRGLLQKMPRVLLDDALVQIFHPHFFIGWLRPRS